MKRVSSLVFRLVASCVWVFIFVFVDALWCVGSELEDAFFEILWRCDSPWLTERDYAEDELTKKFVDFEPIWKNREFLTDGQISAEARQRFELAEASWRQNAAQKTYDSFKTEWNVGAPKSDDEGGLTRRLVLRVEWDATSRIVYFVPKFDALFWRDETDGSVWRPVARFSSPELLPERDVASLEIETTLERVEGDEAENSRVSRSLSFETLVGIDARTLEIEVGSTTTGKIRSGALTIKGATGTRTERGDLLVSFRIDYDAALDAFDSHRAWFEKNDFTLNLEGAENGLVPKRMKTRGRANAGVDIELYFDSNDELDAAFFSKQARVAARLPRFFAYFEKTLEERD